jgi:hypothetical protein
MIVPGSASTMAWKIMSGFINCFMDCRNCGTQADWKTPMLGRENNSQEEEVAVQLGKLKCDFESSALNKDNVENGDETH